MRYAFIVLLAILTGCAQMMGLPSEEDRREYVNKYDLASNVEQGVLNGCPAEGMDYSDLRAAVGISDRMNESTFQGRTRTQFVYVALAGSERAYVYTEGGEVVGWQNLGHVPRLSHCS